MMNDNQKTDEIRIKIKQFYLEILGREPDDEGLEHYLKEIQDGRLDITKLGDIFRNSQEYKLSYPTNLNSKNNSVNEIMKQDWNERARTNTLFVISTDHSDSEKDFWQSGVNDCEKILGRNSDRFSNILQGKDPKKMHVLEIGCGIGRLLIPMSNIFQNVVGIDISPEMVRIGKEKTQEISNCEIVENNGSDLSLFSDNYFDFCYSFIVFQHIPEKKIVEEYIKEVSRVLKPGCLFRFQVRGKISTKPKNITTWDGVQFTSDEIHIMAKKNNFEILEEGDYTKEYYWITFRLAKSF
tara:strand:+ start:308 stop:1195 length:888 start_codon:yes stop_codon:yes gene_type:complete